MAKVSWSIDRRPERLITLVLNAREAGIVMCSIGAFQGDNASDANIAKTLADALQSSMAEGNRTIEALAEASENSEHSI